MPTKVLVPPLGTTVDTVTVVSWYKQEGERIERGAPLFVIETDKANLDVESPATGVLRQVTAKPGDEVKALSVIALIAAPDEALATETPVAQTATPQAVQPIASAPALATAPATQSAARPGRVFISPRARRLAEQEHAPLEALHATGPEGAIIERDVRAYLAQAAKVAVPAPEPVAAARDNNTVAETIPLKSTRAVIAERMLRSRTQTAHVTLTAEADATQFVAWRQKIISTGVKVSYNDLLLYIVSRSLRQHPRLNASLTSEGIQVWQQIHIGLAVDTERGLIVPVVRDVDTKSLTTLARESVALIERARTQQCTPAELTGGTFTITNLGMYGIDAFTPIINLPECAVLGVGRIKRQPVMLSDDRVVGRELVWLSLTFDHRLIDGAPAARFLQSVVQYVEVPELLL